MTSLRRAASSASRFFSARSAARRSAAAGVSRSRERVGAAVERLDPAARSGVRLRVALARIPDLSTDEKQRSGSSGSRLPDQIP